MEIINIGNENIIDANKELAGRIYVDGNNNKIVCSNCLKHIKFTIEGNNNEVFFDENVRVISELTLRITGNNSKITVGRNTSFYSAKILINEDKNSVHIGEDCMISDGIRIFASDSHAITSLENGECINYAKTGIRIGNHVWIGMEAIILKDVQIGDNTVIAAGAIVTSKSNLSNVILAGNPAKVIKEGITWNRNTPKKTNIAQKVKLDARFLEEKMKCFIEQDLKSIDNFNKISGWAFLDECDSNASKIYVELKNDGTYETNFINRKDVATVYGENYNNSGFEFVFDTNKKISDFSEINLIIENGDKFYKNRIYG